METITMNKDQIKEVIPHREPMLLIDEVLEMVPGEMIKTAFYLDPELDFFRGHFPGEPVMPGVLTVESMAQTADVLLLSMEKYAGKVPLFIGIDQVKFKRKIEPGDKIEIEAKIVKVNEPKAVVTCEAVVYNKGEISTTGLVTLAMR
ncbi:3-hydroxyacyl-ACP dehydratase FabZ [Ihubacter massiliensis]|uniref:3-hydroxyacyl-ACP dehydratase FabZ n=1 Tax=Hominibacterium faecale TaxID=2839743 RepID=A0A9J6QRT2_9FIRM|nr:MULTISPECIES: 3-hydroxyacyl-ACP dehydratase FabZ [Eubacteriales Family XIII. Incertae Sedis]MCI7303250.1 3-hydroxyacyl-ACP dehydratase FabZ [Clostridia bacterium]MDE8731505.1 3-hydroxyacyl-ACP dehydratase FabZ [Eubacteriales bacterium DFI.9.88]MDY3010500.1 3-hydroxyacyl-ACP dehydratase FabZ [Clostridiales Family XIII bacterium]MCO7122983.1 3-hydroxyacyl-ACP dehydratase FabZ [Ihubacter massiliensis]MCU7377243.1 3-hydroxyacyl-ACP dehydratase FabZ [Hominibacterium faecale]